MNIAVFGSKIWERFCNILGAPEWITDERYHDKASRSVNRDSLNAEINRRLAAQDRSYWVAQFNEGGVACGLINDMREVFEEPQIRHLGMVKEVVSHWLGPQRLVGQPVQLERTPSTIARAAPRRGEHTEEVLRELGLHARGPRPHESHRSLLMAETTLPIRHTEQVQTWLDGTTLHIRFNNPARHNALSVDMWAAVAAAAAAGTRGRRACAWWSFPAPATRPSSPGADISQFEDMRAAREAVRRYEAMAEETLTGIHDFPKPTLACIRGWCIGGGVNVAISCDIRIASTDSVFSIPAARLGLGYRYSAMKNLVDLIGPGAAKDLFFTARRIDAAEAKALGLVSRICPPEELDALLAEYTSALAENAPLTVAAGKAITREILKASPDQDLALCASLIRGCFESADYAEGRTAFMQKRKTRSFSQTARTERGR